MLKRLWAGWKRVSHAIGNFQARVLLTVFYVVFIIPTGLIARRFSDPLRLRREEAATYWVPRPEPDETLAGAGREF